MARGGASLKYDPKYCKEIIEFSRDAVGTFKAFAAHIEVSYETLYKWAEKYPDFKEAKRIAKAINEKAMWDIGLKGMRGEYGAGSWQGAYIFAMKARHGYRDDVADEDDDSDEANDLEMKFT